MGTCAGFTLSGLSIEGFAQPLKKACAKFNTKRFTKSTAGLLFSFLLHFPLPWERDDNKKASKRAISFPGAG